MPHAYGVHSEVGKLRRVLVHRPGAALARLTKLDPSTLPLVKGKKRFGVPLNGVRKFLAWRAARA